MTRPTVMDKTRLAAFADGELSPEEAAAVVMHLADHPGDQAYVDDLVAGSAALAQAFAAPLTEPVPQRLLAAAGAPTGQVIPLARRGLRWAGAGLALALAASVAVAALIVGQDGPPRLSPGTVTAGSPLARTLDTLPSGVPERDGARETTVLATLPVDRGFCREIEVIDTAADLREMALACREDAAEGDGWRIAVVLSEPLAAPAEDRDAFVPASGGAVAGLTAYLDQLGAGLALTPAEETEAMAVDWQR